ncbi:MAG: HupE/UreJ family protein [Leptolyngbyaceae bacterium]|nr:HupE/UreJ family protein [Leptolyngbyaceae bacterium]
MAITVAFPAYAHHPFGGTTPTNAIEGFLSGLGHPVIGIDHFVFVIAAGLVGVLVQRGAIVPLAFVTASLFGTGLHLQLVNLPVPETVVSASVLLFGLILALGRKSNLAVVAGLGAIAGIFHGYAYGEAIVGAEMTPLVAYLLGFASIQLAISFAAGAIANRVMKRDRAKGLLNLRFVGFAICGSGFAFLSSTILG